MMSQETKILIVDPDPMFSRKLSMILSSEGHDVEAAKGITVAVQRLKDVDFDCVVMDENLPEMKGHDAIPILRAVTPNIPIIITVTQNTLETESRVRQQDIFFYHVKSFDVYELGVAVLNACKSGKNTAPKSNRMRHTTSQAQT